MNKIPTDSKCSQFGAWMKKFHHEKILFVQSATQRTRFTNDEWTYRRELIKCISDVESSKNEIKEKLDWIITFKRWLDRLVLLVTKILWKYKKKRGSGPLGPSPKFALVCSLKQLLVRVYCGWKLICSPKFLSENLERTHSQASVSFEPLTLASAGAKCSCTEQ